MWANESFAVPASSSAGDLDEICNTVYPWRIASATRPFPSPSLESPGTATVDEGLDKRVDGPLDGGSNKDLLEAVLAFERRGRVGLVTWCGASPDLFEDDPSQESAQDRAGEADRTVEDPRGLAGFFLFRHECLPGRLMVVVTALGGLVCRCGRRLTTAGGLRAIVVVAWLAAKFTAPLHVLS